MDILAYPVCLFFVGDEIHVYLLSDNSSLRIWAGAVVSVENNLEFRQVYSPEIWVFGEFPLRFGLFLSFERICIQDVAWK